MSQSLARGVQHVLEETIFHPYLQSSAAGSRATLLNHDSGEDERTLYKHFTSVSQDLSGHQCQTDRAPMLVGAALADKVSAKVAVEPALRIR